MVANYPVDSGECEARGTEGDRPDLTYGDAGGGSFTEQPWLEFSSPLIIGPSHLPVLHLIASAPEEGLQEQNYIDGMGVLAHGAWPGDCLQRRRFGFKVREETEEHEIQEPQEGRRGIARWAQGVSTRIGFIVG